MFAGVEDRPPLQAHHPRLLVAGEVLVPGDDQGVHVADASSRGQDAVPFGPADDLPHLEQHFVLHHDKHRRDLVGEHVGVGSGRQPLSCHAHDVQALGQLVEEVWMARLDLVAESGAAVGDQRVQGHAGVGDAEVHGLGDLRGVVEVQHVDVPVIGLVDEVQHDLHHGVEELAGELLRVGAADDWKYVCKVRNSIESIQNYTISHSTFVGFPDYVKFLFLKELPDVKTRSHRVVISQRV